MAQNPRLFPSASPRSTQPDASAANTKKEATGKKSLNGADKGFINDAAKGGMMEVAMGRLAEQNASSADVKAFGAQMVKDHSKANSELKSLASEEGMELPAAKEPPKWKSDKDYMTMMVKDHEEDLALFEKEAKNGTDADLKQFAEKTSAVVRKHLQMAKDTEAKLK